MKLLRFSKRFCTNEPKRQWCRVCNIVCENIVIVVLTMCDLTLSVFCQNQTNHSKQCAVKSSNVRLASGSQFQSSRPTALHIFMSLLVNTPDSDNQLVRSALHE